MSSMWKYFKDEKFKKFFSSKKRIVKFFAICLVPFLYGFVCIWAFWNPVSNIGEVPMAVVDTSNRVNLVIGIGKVEENNAQKNKLLIGEPSLDKSGNPILDGNGFPVAIIDPSSKKEIPFSECLLYEPNFSFVENFLESWDDNSNPNALINKNKNGTYSVALSESQWLNNVSYFNDKTAIKATDVAVFDKNMTDVRSGNKGAWSVKNEDYWLQTQIPEDFNSILLNAISWIFINGISGPNHQLNNPNLYWKTELAKLKQTPINVWATFKKNFLFGQFMKVFDEFKSSLLIDFFPKLISQTLVNSVSQITESTKNNYLKQLSYTPEQDLNIIIPKLEFHKGSKQEYSKTNVEISLKANQEYIFKNDEILNAIKTSNQIKNNPEELKKLSAKKTFEGNTTNLVKSRNNWEINTENLSYIDLISSFFKPLDNEAATNNLAKGKNLIKDFAYKYSSNKMFLSSLLEKDFNIMPKKPIVPFVDKVIIDKLKPIITDQNIPGIFDSQKLVITSQEWKAYSKKMSTTLQTIVNTILDRKDNLTNAPPIVVNNLEGILTSGVLGEEYSPYGIGLGQFFLCIGIWVGCLMQTFVLDRTRIGSAKKPKLKASKKDKKIKKSLINKRYLESIKWYYSKSFLMLSITFIQVSILCLTVYALGWSAIGSSFWLVYIQLLFSGFVFTLFIQALWFLFRDDVVGKFIVILFLIINLSSGWGTFPPSMQFGFFKVLSYIAPFTYTIKNLGAIVYGVAISGANTMDTMFIMQNIGITLIFLLISIFLGLFAAFKLTKQQFYGTANGKKIAKLIIDDKLTNARNCSDYNLVLNSDNQNFDSNYDWKTILIKKKSLFSKKMIDTIDWDKLDYGFNKQISNIVNKNYPYEKQFKWFVKKYPDHKNEMKDASL